MVSYISVIHKNGKQAVERRRHLRLNVVDDLVEPIVLRYVPTKGEKESVAAHLRTQPAILTNLSAGGLSLVTFLAPPHAKKFKMTLTIPGLNHMPVEGKVVRIHEKGDTFSVGIQFTKIAQKFQKKIGQMAEHDRDCNTRITLGLPEACVPVCCFHFLCTKPQKAPHWPPKV